MKFTKPIFHAVIGVCLTTIAMTALLMKEYVIAGTALGTLSGYVIKNGVFNNDK